MGLIKKLLWMVIQAFFNIFFLIVGKPSVSPALQQTLDLYKDVPFFELFSLIRIWDSPFESVNKVTPNVGIIIDLGCGDGTQTNYLALSSIKRKMIGIELNQDRVGDADKGLKNAKFRVGDITKIQIPKADGIILTHVLHHLPTKDDQVKVLKKIKKSLNKNGTLVIVEIVEKPILKYLFTWITDAFIVPILFEGQMYDFNFHYRKQFEWEHLLDKLGFKYTIEFPHVGKPFSHVIFKCSMK